MKNANRKELPSEETVREVLLKHKGDLMKSSSDLACRPSTLVRWIKSVPSVAALWETMETVKADPAFEKASQSQFADEIRSRAMAYRLDGLEVIHELATTDHDGNASMAEVRLKAAIQLQGVGEIGSSSTSSVLAELNALYHEHAPRIRSMRAVQIEFDVGPETAGTVGQQLSATLATLRSPSSPLFEDSDATTGS